MSDTATDNAAFLDDIASRLVVLEMGLRFAICHRDFGSTREAIKKEIPVVEQLLIDFCNATGATCPKKA